MNKINPKIKIVAGIALIIAGFFGLKLTVQGFQELGKLDGMKLNDQKEPEILSSAALQNQKFIKCQQENEKKGRIYVVLHTFLEGQLIDDTVKAQIIENEKQCAGE